MLMPLEEWAAILAHFSPERRGFVTSLICSSTGTAAELICCPTRRRKDIMDILWEAFMRIVRRIDPIVAPYAATQGHKLLQFRVFLQSGSDAIERLHDPSYSFAGLKDARCCANEAIPARMSRAMGTWLSSHCRFLQKRDSSRGLCCRKTTKLSRCRSDLIASLKES